MVQIQSARPFFKLDIQARFDCDGDVPRLPSGFRLRGCHPITQNRRAGDPGAQTPARRLKFKSTRPDQFPQRDTSADLRALNQLEAIADRINRDADYDTGVAEWTRITCHRAASRLDGRDRRRHVFHVQDHMRDRIFQVV